MVKDSAGGFPSLPLWAQTHNTATDRQYCSYKVLQKFSQYLPPPTTPARTERPCTGGPNCLQSTEELLFKIPRCFHCKGELGSPSTQPACTHGEGSFSHWEHFTYYFYHSFLLWGNDLGLSHFSTGRWKNPHHYEPKSFASKQTGRLVVRSI